MDRFATPPSALTGLKRVQSSVSNFNDLPPLSFPRETHYTNGMKIVVTGATGFIGNEVVHTLVAREPNHEIRVLTRNPEKAAHHFRGLTQVKSYKWDPEREVAPATALENADVILHLAGENIGAGRWSPEIKRRIMDSRKLGTRNLVAGLNLLTTPHALISISATGYYGARGNEILTEESAPGEGFLAEVCKTWEEEAHLVKTPRLTIFRLGVVLGEGGGALEKLLPLFKRGLGGRIGDGKNWMSWIDRRDVIELLVQAVVTPEKFQGTYNAVAPEPVTNQVFTGVLGSTLHRPTLLPVPTFALKLAFGEMAKQTILASQRVIPARLLSQGYSFHYPTLRSSLASLMVEVPHS